MWFDSWADSLRTLLVGSASYAALISILRFSGKRTLAQLNAFDLVVTVALGSTFATILLSSEVAWVEGVIAIGLLVALQFVVARASTRWPIVRRVIAASPVAVARAGRLDHDALRRHRLTEAEVLQAARSAGYGDLDSVAVVVLETNGTISIISDDKLGRATTLEGVQ